MGQSDTSAIYIVFFIDKVFLPAARCEKNHVCAETALSQVCSFLQLSRVDLLSLLSLKSKRTYKTALATWRKLLSQLVACT